MIPTILADDHPIVRQGLRTLLEVEDGCEIIGEASDGLTAIDLITRLRPAIAVDQRQIGGGVPRRRPEREHRR